MSWSVTTSKSVRQSLCGSTRGRMALARANALERGHSDAGDTTHFEIQFSKLRNSKKCQHTQKSPKLKVTEEL
jgi:hypothetical protein